MTDDNHEDTESLDDVVANEPNELVQPAENSVVAKSIDDDLAGVRSITDCPAAGTWVRYLWFVRPLAWLLLTLVVLLLFVYPLLVGALMNSGKLPLSYLRYLSYVENAQTYLMRLLGLLWVFFFGSCFASFLNVVAWRVPRGRGINGSSHCPFCDSKLKFFDNIPIYGWLHNSGRCRTCRAPIAPRYLFVELILGCAFLLLFAVQVLGGGFNLPFIRAPEFRHFEQLMVGLNERVLPLTVFHLTLVCLLFTYALIRSDRLLIPRAIWFFGLGLGLVLPLAFPTMNLVPWRITENAATEMARFSLDQWLTLGCGVVTGAAIGLLFARKTIVIAPRLAEPQPIDTHFFVDNPDGTSVEGAEPLPDAESKTTTAATQPALNSPARVTSNQSVVVGEGVACSSLIGLWLGWQAVVAVALIAAALHWLAVGYHNRGFDSRAPASTSQQTATWLNSSTIFWISVMLHLLTWRLWAVDGTISAASEELNWRAALAFIAAILLIHFLPRWRVD